MVNTGVGWRGRGLAHQYATEHFDAVCVSSGGDCRGIGQNHIPIPQRVYSVASSDMKGKDDGNVWLSWAVVGMGAGSLSGFGVAQGDPALLSWHGDCGKRPDRHRQPEVGAVRQEPDLPDGEIVALNGEAGVQADTLAPGMHFGLWPWQYAVSCVKFYTIDKGQIGIVEARDGPAAYRAAGCSRKAVECNSFQNARAFLLNGGERGPQISIIPPGTYRINTALFRCTLGDGAEIPDNQVGIVTTKEGAPLADRGHCGQEIAGHNMFQDARGLITNGGHKGLQEQVMLAGRYFINPLFATVEIKPMTEVPIANVGVVIAYVGEEGVDRPATLSSTATWSKKGQKGVWVDPLDPGKYPINPYTHKVRLFPRPTSC